MDLLESRRRGFISPAGKENRNCNNNNNNVATPLSWDATPSPNCLNASISTLTLDFTSSPFLPLGSSFESGSCSASAKPAHAPLRARNQTPRPRGEDLSPFSLDDSSLLDTPEFKIPTKPRRRGTPKPTFVPAEDDDEDDDDDEDENEDGDLAGEVGYENHDWSYEDNVYDNDDDDDDNGDVDQETAAEDYDEDPAIHMVSPIAHRSFPSETYSSSLPASFPSLSHSALAEYNAEDTPGCTPVSASRFSTSSSAHSTPPSFSTPPIPHTKTTPFLRLKRDPHALRSTYQLNASIIVDASGQTPGGGATPGRSRSRFHTPPLPSPARTTPFFVSKVRARDRVKTPQTKPLWARDPHHYSASGFSDESYDYEEDLAQDLGRCGSLNGALLTPPLPSPTRTITFITPYAVKSRPRSISDGHHTSEAGFGGHCLTPVKAFGDDDDEREENGGDHQFTPTSSTGVAGLRYQLPPSPDFPSPPTTTMFLYYRPVKPKREDDDDNEAVADDGERDESIPAAIIPTALANQAKVKVKVEKSLDSPTCSFNLSDFEREKERLERELEQEMLKVVNDQHSPASLPPTSTFHFDPHSPFFAQKFSFSASMTVEETCKRILPTDTLQLAKYETEEGVSVESLEDSLGEVDSDAKNRLTV